MKSKKAKHIIRICSFSAILVVVVCLISHFFFFNLGPDTTSYGTFYKETKDSLDLVMVGSSTVRDGFIPMEAYKQYGITSHSIDSSPTHLEVIEIAIDEIARTQKPKVVYIDLNGLNNQTKSNAKTFVQDYYSSMPSDDETNEIKKKLREKYNYLVDSSSWEPFSGHNSFRQQIYWESFVYNKQFYTKGYYPQSGVKEAKVCEVDPDKTLPLSEDAQTYLQEILDICKKYPDINFIFGQMPRYLSDEITSFDMYQIHSPLEAMYMVRSAKTKVEEYGYKFVDFSSLDFLQNTLKLDPKTDQYDAEHLNHRGATKFTTYFSKYLIDEYFNKQTPTHSENVTKAFDEAYTGYKKVVASVEKKLGM